MIRVRSVTIRPDINTYPYAPHSLYVLPGLPRWYIPAVLLVLLLALVGQSASYPVEPFSIHLIQKLLDSADLVVVGRVSEVHELGTASVEYLGNKYPGHSFLAGIEVDEVIKGDSSRFLNVGFEQAVVAGQGLIEPQVSSEMHRVFFLHEDNDGWVPVSSGYAVLPAGTDLAARQAKLPSVSKPV